MPRHFGLMLLASTALAACTTTVATLPVKPVSAPAGSSAMIGIPYRLPAVAYDLVATRTLTKCKDSGKTLTAEFSVAVVPTPVITAGEEFIVDYRSLANWHKIGNSKLEYYPNGTIKSFNATATDKSSEIITNVITAAAKVAKLVFAPGVGGPIGGGGPEGSSGSEEKPKPSRCPAELATADTNKAAQVALATQTVKAVKEHDALQLKVVLGTATEAERAQVKPLEDTIAAQAAQLKIEVDAWTELDAKLSHREAYHFVPTGTDATLAMNFPSADSLIRTEQINWLRQLITGLTDDELEHISTDRHIAIVKMAPGPLFADNICANSGVTGISCGATAAPIWKNYRRSGQVANVIPGVVYREPAQGTLLICATERIDACKAGTVVPDSATPGNFPQLGRLVILPFHNGWGEDNELKVTFLADGSVDTFSYDAKAAPGVAASKVLNDAVDSIGSVNASIRADRKAAREAAKTAADTAAAAPGKALTDAITDAESQKKLLDAKAAIDPANVEAVRALAAVNVRIAKLQADKVLADLEAGKPR